MARIAEFAPFVYQTTYPYQRKQWHYNNYTFVVPPSLTNISMKKPCQRTRHAAAEAGTFEKKL